MSPSKRLQVGDIVRVAKDNMAGRIDELMPVGWSSGGPSARVTWLNSGATTHPLLRNLIFVRRPR